MKEHENAAFRRLASRVLVHHTGTDVGADAFAAAAYRAYDDLSRASAQLIGQAGVDALTARALHLAQRQYPWLVHRREPEQAEGPFAQVIVCLKRQDPAVATEAAAAVLAVLVGLLVTFIGESLTTQLVQKAWPDAFTDSDAEKAKV